MSTEWLKHAIFYEVYPQSFKDTNADGIGDIPGIIEKLDYIRDLGCDAVWLNPCFDSPFVDAGYDVRDFYRVAPRYGTNEDLKHLFEEAHKRDMHVILDLVAGHTSLECEWFKKSSLPEKNEYTDRYIWTDTVWNAPTNVGNIRGWYRGGYDRDGAAAVNFFTAQPALNYGFREIDPGCESWQHPTDSAGALSTRKELMDIMRFWLGLGCDGFRVDMAGSLVKNDPDSKGTIALWQDFRKMLDASWPDAVLVSEWGEADKALEAGFHMDFVLHFGPSHYPELFRTETPFFSSTRTGSAKPFFDLYLANREKTYRKGGMICIPSGNHDMYRMASSLSRDEMKIAFAFLLSMPGVPFIYYGDEIGMRHIEGIPSVEGGYYRTGARSPMQWNTCTNAGFSSAPKDKLYIPQDEEMMREINVETEQADPGSLYHEVKKLTALRKKHPALANTAGFRMLNYETLPLAYERSSAEEKILVLINPSGMPAETDLDTRWEVLYSFGEKTLSGNTLPAQSAFFLRIGQRV